MRRKFKIYIAFLSFIVVVTSASILLNFTSIVKGHSALQSEQKTDSLYHHLVLSVKKSQAELYKFEAGFTLDLDALLKAVETVEDSLESVSNIEGLELHANIDVLTGILGEYKNKVSLVVTGSSPERKDLSARDASALGAKMEEILEAMGFAVEKRMTAINLEVSEKIKVAETMLIGTVAVVIIVAFMIWLHFRSTIAAPFSRFIHFVESVSKSRDLSLRFELPKDSDLATLAVRFNEMMSHLEIKGRELEDSLDELSISNEELQNSYTNLEELTTELESKSQDLVDANEELKGMDRMKNEFMQNVSHELRTPLTPIVGYLELFASNDLGELNPVQTEIMSDMYHCSKRLGFAIDSLLEMVSLQEEQLTEKFETIDVKAMVTDVEDMIREDVEDKKLSYEIECEEGLRPVMGARKKMILMLNHILKNAVKFTREGGKLGFFVGYGETEDIKFVISDSGVGICEDKLKSIFEPFLQADSSTTRGFEGVGLGLALVKRVVEMHRGEICIDSVEDEGTTVTVSIPLA